MQAVTVSPKFQVVIPQAVRRALGLVPGVKLQVVHFENRIELIPMRSSKSLRGIATAVPREPDRCERR